MVTFTKFAYVMFLLVTAFRVFADRLDLGGVVSLHERWIRFREPDSYGVIMMPPPWDRGVNAVWLVLVLCLTSVIAYCIFVAARARNVRALGSVVAIIILLAHWCLYNWFDSLKTGTDAWVFVAMFVVAALVSAIPFALTRHVLQSETAASGVHSE